MKKVLLLPLALFSVVITSGCGGKSKSAKPSSSSVSIFTPSIPSTPDKTFLSTKDRVQLILSSPEFTEKKEFSEDLREYVYEVTCSNQYVVSLKTISTATISNLKVTSNLSFTLGDFKDCTIQCSSSNPENSSLSFEFKYVANIDSAITIKSSEETYEITNEESKDNKTAQRALSTYVAESIECTNKCIGFIQQVLKRSDNIDYSILAGE